MDTNESNIKTIVCYGEVLWDVFPTHTKPGGAPMNVAYHLKKFGIRSKMISRVGNDILGEQLTALLDSWGIPSENCGKDSDYPTGSVKAEVLENNEMKYTIMPNAAWDHIITTEADEKMVSEADAFVFGSLVTRDTVSRNTLYRLIEKAKYRVFDVNLRPPFYSQEIISYLLEKCNLLKLNESELQLLCSWYIKDPDISEASAVETLRHKFNIDEVIVTKGSEGACYYSEDKTFIFPAFKITVKDTVGSGDSFLAAFLSKKIQQRGIENAMIHATALGAFVASCEGACPHYELSQITDFILENQIDFAITQS